jgi:uncharacterized repeat protein (TIGR02543 family)
MISKKKKYPVFLAIVLALVMPFMMGGLTAAAAETFTVRFELEYGTGTAAPITVTNGGIFGTLPGGITREGYTFAGWWTEPATGGSQIISTTPVSGLTGDIWLYARWTLNVSFTVSFDLQGGTGTANPQTVSNGDTVILPADPTRTGGFEFGGWWTAPFGPYGTGVQVTRGTTDFRVTGNLTLFAYWAGFELVNTIDLSVASPVSEGIGWSYLSGVYTINDGFTVNVVGTGNKSITVSGSGTAAISGNIGLTNITVPNGSSLTLSGSGSVTVNGSVNVAQGGTLIVQDGVKLIVNGALNNNGDVVNGGNIDNNGTVTNGSTGNIENNGTITNNPNGTVDNGGTITNGPNGNINNNGDVTNGPSGTVDNGGTITNGPTGTIDNDGDINNGPTGTIDNNGNVSNNPTGTIDNDGDIINGPNGTIDNEGDINNGPTGTIDNNGDVANGPNGTIDNEGDINNSPTGTIDNEGDINNKPGGNIDNEGDINNKPGGSIDNGGTLVNGGDGSINNDGGIINGGDFVDDGDFTGEEPTGNERVVTVTISVVGGVIAPVSGVAPATTVIETAQFTGVITWSPAVTGAFGHGVQYTATITLTAKDGFSFGGVSADFFAVAGAVTVTNGANRGVITAVFPTTGKLPAPAAPGAPTVAENGRTSTSITLVAIAGYEYRLGNGVWTTNNVFSGLTANTSYTFYQRIAETHDTYASASSVALTVYTLKSPGPSIPELPVSPEDAEAEAKTSSSITVAAVQAPAGYTVEYGIATSRDGEITWQAGREFTGLGSNTEYFFFVRVAEGSNNEAGEARLILIERTERSGNAGAIFGATFGGAAVLIIAGAFALVAMKKKKKETDAKTLEAVAANDKDNRFIMYKKIK